MKVIAIDGPAASGKGTLAKKLAQELGMDHLDTGLLYRNVAYLLWTSNLSPEDAEASEKCALSLQFEHLVDDQRIRTEEIGKIASICSAHAGVRKALYDFQRDFGINPPSGVGAVLDGRDIGTSIFPEAPVKLWVFADSSIRAQRRHKENPSELTVEQIKIMIDERDEREMKRLVSPLIKAPDAHDVNTGVLNIEETLDLAKEIVRETFKNARKIRV